MMSHPQYEQLSHYQNPRLHYPESSLPSSSSPKGQKHGFQYNSNFINKIKRQQQQKITSTSSSCRPSLATKLIRSFSHQDLLNRFIASLLNLYYHPSWFLCFEAVSGLELSCSEVLIMSNPRGLSVRTPSEIRKKVVGGQRNKEELEREVSLLQTMLNQEEKVHEALDYAYSRKSNESASAIQIPRFLPQKTQELLVELAMVEGEIDRLEDQIRQLKVGLKHEGEATKEPKARQWQHETLSLMNRGVHHERKGYETKALHFISKAIKGDYELNNELNVNEKMENLRGFSDQKENYFSEEVRFQSKAPRKGGLLSAPSPLRAPRHPSAPKLSELKPGISSDHLPPKPLPIPTQLEENNQIWQPNKLSEEILKCLNLIYVRLLRTTRTMELEKSGPISRSLHSSIVTSRSFRDDTGQNSKSSLLLQKESRQQDPYGIFNVEDSIPRDIGPYKNLVIFTSISMDPRSISASNSIPLLKKLRVLLNNLLVVDLGSLTYQQKLAFWINMYNACIMNGFLEFGAHPSADKLLTLLNKATLNIGGKILNAQSIEHYILRKPAPSSSMKEAFQKGENDDKATVRQLYGLESMDPNVTFALCCGTRSSPALRIYTADSVVAELEKSKLEYLQASIVVASTKKIAFPELLLGNMLDFATDVDSLVQWVCHQLPTSGSLRKSMVDCFRRHSSGKISTTVEKMPYDFEFHYLLAM